VGHLAGALSKTMRTCEQLLKVEPAFWLFVRQPCGASVDIEIHNSSPQLLERQKCILVRLIGTVQLLKRLN